MKKWEELNDELKNINPALKQDFKEMEILVEIVSAIIKKRSELGLSQRELAKMCNLPQSSIARIESCHVIPKVETLLKIMAPLGLKLVAVSMWIGLPTDLMCIFCTEAIKAIDLNHSMRVLTL